MALELITIVTSPGAPALETKAATELANYIEQLFGIGAQVAPQPAADADALFLIGSPQTNPAVGRAAGDHWPALSDQGFVLRKVTHGGVPTIVAGGASPVATLWAVYELVERYGVRYLLHEDVLPHDPGPFHLPEIDATFEPVQKIRSWRVMNCLPHGPETWRLCQQQQFIDQIAKLKFNGIYLCLWPWQPFVHYAYQGLERSWATLNFGSLYHLDENCIGHERVPRDNWLHNPDLEGAETYQEMLEVGQKFIHDILAHAQQRGMMTSIAVQPLEFPAEFAPVLQQSSLADQLGSLTVSERGDLNNPQHVGLVETLLCAYLDTYPEVDQMTLGIPEHPHAEEQVVEAWEAFNKRANLEPEYTLEGLIAQAERNFINSGGPSRAVRELKSSISMLHFFNHLMESTDVLERARDKGVALGVTNNGGNELYPLMDRLLWPEARFFTGVNYTASTAIRELHLVEQLDTSRLHASLIVTLQDDNIGPLPQVATSNLQHLLDMMARCGWQGFYTRFWPLDELDPPSAFLARASWDNSVTPETVYNDHAAHVYGPEAVRPFNLAMIQLELMTAVLDTEYLSLFFPVPNTMARLLESAVPMPLGLHQIRGAIRRCRDIFAQMLELPGGAAAKEANLEHWIARCEFGMTLIDQREQLILAGCARQAVAEADDRAQKAEHWEAFERYVQCALELGEKACWLLADHVRDDSDRGQLAAFNQFVLREVREKAEAIRQELQE